MRAVMLRAMAVSALSLVAAPVAHAQGISIGDASVSEGNIGTTAMSFNVTLSAPAAGAVSVDFGTQDNGSASAAAANSDYDIKNGTVVFAAGETVKSVTIDVRGDTVDENDETFDVRLSNATGGATIADGTGVGTILDNDNTAPEPTVGINDVTVDEGHTGTTKATFTVSLNAPATRTLEYDVTTTNGETTGERNAAPNLDFYSNHERVTFLMGEQSKTFSVDVIGDRVNEADEFFIVRMTRVGYQPGAIHDGEGIGFIRNDDAPAAVAGAAAAARVCLSRRNFSIRLRDHLYARRHQITRAVVFVDGRRVRVRIGRRLTSIVDLRRKPKKTVNVDITLQLDDGSVIKRQRRYRLCEPRKLDDGIPPEL